MEARIEISDISADILLIYRISVPIEIIFAIENGLMEKSENIGEISSIYRPRTEISVDFSALRHTRTWGHFFSKFSSIYRRLRVRLRLILQKIQRSRFVPSFQRLV